MKKIFLLTGFFFVTPLVFFLNIFLLLYFGYQQDFTNGVFSNNKKQHVVYAALPNIQNDINVEITQEDARTELVRQFFAQYNSPLEPFAKDVVFYADLYGLDFRIIPSIAMQESNLCLKAPQNSKNCWGYGIYGGKIKTFGSYPEGIHEVTKTLSTVYKNKGLHTPEEIMTRYTPSSNGSWANGVTFFMDKLQ